MKNIFLIFIVFFISCTAKKAAVEQPARDHRKLTWEENFDGATIDATKWSKIPRGRSDWNKFMSNYDSLYAVKNGNLILRGIKNITQTNDTASYITGGVYNKGKAAFGRETGNSSQIKRC